MATPGPWWDSMVIGREITRPLGLFSLSFSSSLLSVVSGPRHSEFAEFAKRMQTNSPTLIGIIYIKI